MLAPNENIHVYNLSLLSLIRKGQEGKGYNSINYVWNLFKIYSGQLDIDHKLCAKYHDPRSSGYPDILFRVPLMAKIFC